jgi:hypothetical protein
MNKTNTIPRNLEDEVGIFIGEYIVYKYEEVTPEIIKLDPPAILKIVLKEFKYDDIKHLEIGTLVDLTKQYVPAFYRQSTKLIIET